MLKLRTLIAADRFVSLYLVEIKAKEIFLLPLCSPVVLVAFITSENPLDSIHALARKIYSFSPTLYFRFAL